MQETFGKVFVRICAGSLAALFLWGVYIAASALVATLKKGMPEEDIAEFFALIYLTGIPCLAAMIPAYIFSVLAVTGDTPGFMNKRKTNELP